MPRALLAFDFDRLDAEPPEPDYPQEPPVESEGGEL